MREEDLQLLITLDDPGNAQEIGALKNHQAEHTATYHRSGQPDQTRGRHVHRAEDIIDIDSYIDVDSYEVTSSTSAGKEHRHEL